MVAASDACRTKCRMREHQNGLTRESTTEYVDWDRFDAEQGGEAEAAEQGGGEQGARVTSWWRGVGESVSSYSVGCRGACQIG